MPKSKSLNKKEEKEVKKIVKNLIVSTSELQVHQLGQNGVNIASNSSPQILTDLPRGNDEGDFAGNSVIPQRLSFRAIIQGSSGDDTNLCRLIIFRWIPNTTPTLGDILDDQVGGAPRVLCEYTTEARDNFNILYDNTWSTSAQVSSSIVQRYVSKSLKLANKHITFDVAAADPQNNHIYSLAISDSTAVTHPTLYMVSRFVYMDK